MSFGLARAVILAAGAGSRLKWLTRDKPKALMEIGGVPVIVHAIRRLASQGIRDIAVNLHHHAGQIERLLGDGSGFGVRVFYSREGALLDSGGGVRTALDQLPGNGMFAVHNADVLSDIRLADLAAATPEKGCCLAMVPNPKHHPEGDFMLEDGRIAPLRDGGPGYTYTGVAVFDDAAWRHEPPGAAFPFTDILDRLMRQGRLHGVIHRGQWRDVGRPLDLMLARKDVVYGRQ